MTSVGTVTAAASGRRSASAQRGAAADVAVGVRVRHHLVELHHGAGLFVAKLLGKPPGHPWRPRAATSRPRALTRTRSFQSTSLPIFAAVLASTNRSTRSGACVATQSETIPPIEMPRQRGARDPLAVHD